MLPLGFLEARNIELEKPFTAHDHFLPFVTPAQKQRFIYKYVQITRVTYISLMTLLINHTNMFF